MVENQYTEDNIRSLDWKEHIRLRPGMYIGKLGDGAAADDGIYILVKETIDNCIDEFVMGNGKKVEVKIKDGKVSVRDYGRGIPLGKVVDVVSKMNTGGKYDWHQDVLWSQKLHRKFTYIIQLSEKNEYTGGDFEFRDAKHIDMKHARDVGTMIVFPSILYHRVTPLIKGQRHSIVGWVVGPQWK